MGLGSLHGGEAELLYVHVCVCDCVCVCALVFEAEKGLNWMHKMAAALSPFPPLSLFARSGSTNTYAHTKKTGASKWVTCKSAGVWGVGADAGVSSPGEASSFQLAYCEAASHTVGVCSRSLM